MDRVIAAILLGFASKGELYTYAGPFDLQVTQVRSVAPEQRAGFGKTKGLYAVSADSPRTRYLLYCVALAPEAGTTYKSTEVFLSRDYSFLHLWPVDRADVPIPDLPKKGEKTLYRVVVIQNASSGTKSDLACDIKTKTPLVILP